MDIEQHKTMSRPKTQAADPLTTTTPKPMLKKFLEFPTHIFYISFSINIILKEKKN
jgi:hypothetical protein